MKSIVSFFGVVLFSLPVFAQTQERGIIGTTNWYKSWAEFKPNKVEYPEANKTVPNIIKENYTLTNTNTYALEGKVYVTNGATLTIEEGTVIRCDQASASALIITRGSKIKAEGSSLNPIVFTSNKPANARKTGDWSGIMILGDAPLNIIGGQANIGYDTDASMGIYGGNNVESNSGSMKYVRIEFAGQKTENKKEQNSLTLAGVGNKTVIEHVMASFSQDDSFEFLGGNMVLKNLVSYKARDDDFDFNLGSQVTISNSIAIRNPYLTSPVGPRSVEIDNFEKPELLDPTKKNTNIILNDVTMINEGAELITSNGLKKEAIYVNEMCELTLRKAVISGFKPAVLLTKKIDPKPSSLAKIKIEMLYLHLCDGSISSELGANYDDSLEGYYSADSFNNRIDKTGVADIFKDPKNSSMPDYRIKINDIK